MIKEGISLKFEDLIPQKRKDSDEDEAKQELNG